MKFEACTVAALAALLVGPVLGKPLKGLRRDTKVRVDLRIFAKIFFVFWWLT
jgi:hypothetical protein